MKLAALAATATLPAIPPSVVSGQVGSLAVPRPAAPTSLVYTVNGGGNDDGVYVRGSSLGPALNAERRTGPAVAGIAGPSSG